MRELPSLLIAASAAVVFALGALHRWYTFRGNTLHPRDPELRVRLEQVPMVLNRHTTMWNAWVGFNASHGGAALLFGTIYGYLALAHRAFLFRSGFLLALGLLWLVGYAILAKRYWFSRPFHGVLLAAAFYLGALVIAAL